MKPIQSIYDEEIHTVFRQCEDIVAEIDFP